MKEQTRKVCQYLMRRAKKKLGSHLSARYNSLIPFGFFWEYRNIGKDNTQNGRKIATTATHLGKTRMAGGSPTRYPLPCFSLTEGLLNRTESQGHSGCSHLLLCWKGAHKEGVRGGGSGLHHHLLHCLGGVAAVLCIGWQITLAVSVPNSSIIQLQKYMAHNLHDITYLTNSPILWQQLFPTLGI